MSLWAGLNGEVTAAIGVTQRGELGMQNVVDAMEPQSVQLIERDPLEAFIAGWLDQHAKSAKTHAVDKDTMHSASLRRCACADAD